MTMPSRDFLVRQAALMAISRDMGSLASIHGALPAYTKGRFDIALRGGRTLGVEKLCAQIRVEFRNLVSQYEAAK